MPSRARATAAALLAGALLAGCGDDEEFANEGRPPAPITVSAVVTERGVTVSPRGIGAGPIWFIVSNQTDSSRQVVLESEDPAPSEPGLAAHSTGPINPGGTAKLKVDVQRGLYEVRVRGFDPARLRVSGARPSAQNELLLP